MKKTLTLSLIMILALSSFAVFADEVVQVEGPRADSFSEEFKIEMNELRVEMQEARENEDTELIEELKDEIKALFEEYGYTPRDLFRRDIQHIRGDMRDDYKEGDAEGFRQNSEKLINRMQARNQMLQNRLENR